MQILDAEDSLNDAVCLTKLKVGVAQIGKKSYFSFRFNSTRPSSATSSRSNRTPIPSASESLGDVQSMRKNRQQQQVNDLAEQQSKSNPNTIRRQVQSAMGVLQENNNRVISTDVQNSLHPAALEKTNSDNVAINQNQTLQLMKPSVKPTTFCRALLTELVRSHNCLQLQIFHCQFPLEQKFMLETFSLLLGLIKTIASLNM